MRLHHAEPTLAWHRRPARYRAVRTDLLRASRYHLIASYAQLARNYLFEAKEPLLHPSLVRASGRAPVRTGQQPGYRLVYAEPYSFHCRMQAFVA